MQQDVIVALDIGTSSVRAGVFDLRAVPIAAPVARPQQVDTENGGADINAETMVDSVTTCLQEASAGYRVRAVALSTFWHSAVGVDGDGRAVTPVLTWADTRAGAQVRFLQAHVDVADVHRRTGCLVHTSYLPARLRWVKEVHPEWRVVQWLSPGEYLMRRLAGRSVCSLSMATATGLFDSRRKMWDAELMDLCGVVASQLPEVSDGAVEVAGVRWMAPLGDGACSNVGCGAIGEGDVAIMLGTSGALRRLAAWPTEDWSVPDGLWRYALDARRVVTGGAVSNGGNVWAWMDQVLAAGEVEGEPDGHGLTMLPFLAGERSPGWHSEARATLHGLRWGTTAADIRQAGMEAVAYQLAAVRDRLPRPARLVATGGVFERSPQWLQMLADALGEPLYRSPWAEASSRGAVLMALDALGLIEALAPVPLGEAVEPCMDRHVRYAAGRRRQEELYRTFFPS
ncbi:MAG TPA: gluconokinase [Candidatus Xenobia bacterium]|jgi:gluconokinase